MSQLLILFMIPWVVATLVALLPSFFNSRQGRGAAFVLSLIPLGYLLSLRTEWLHLSFTAPWIPFMNISFHLAVDPLTLVFLYLTAIITPLVIALIDEKQHFFYILTFLLQGFLIAFFAARDLVMFTVFWEAMLLPLFLIIACWGGEKRRATALKFLVYMIAGSTLMVAAVLALHFTLLDSQGVNTFDFSALIATAEKGKHAELVFLAFMLAFCVKTPLFPFHAWLPDTYCQAPVPGTILLSAILSKAGIYGILRIGRGFFPTLFAEWENLFLLLAISGVIYGALAAFVQKDFKRLIAYSSFSHVNFILAGAFVVTALGEEGAVLQALNHGVTIAGLFLVAWWLEERIGGTAFSYVSGAASYFPNLCWITLCFLLSSVALPGTNNFIGEFMILLALFGKNYVLATFLASAVVLSAIYMLRWMQKIYFEKPHHTERLAGDLRWREALLAAPLLFLIFWVGIYPQPLLNLLMAKL